MPGSCVTPGFLPFALRAALRAFKIAPADFVLWASCPSPFGPHFVRSKSLQPILYYGLPALRPSGRTSCVQNRSRRFCTMGFLPFALRAALRAFKIAPGDFVAGMTLLFEDTISLFIIHYQQHPRIPFHFIRATRCSDVFVLFVIYCYLVCN